MTTTRRAIIYGRMSMDRTGAGLGIDRQVEDSRERAAQLGWTVVAVRADNDLSAYTGKPRPGYIAMLEDLKADRADAVIAWHADRLHRSPVELEGYIAVCDPRNIPTQTVKAGPLDLSTPSGRMVARVLGAVARHEVEHMVERKQRARLQAADEGRWAGGRRPYGYQVDGVTIVEAEAAIIRWASEQVLAGRSLRSLAAELNARDERTSTGGPWRQDTIRDVLLRPRNAGLMQHRGEVVGRAGWPALLTEDLWRGVVAVLTDPSRRTNPGAPPRWLLSGLARCGVCGAIVRATSSGRSARGGRVKPAYVCVTGKHVVRDAAEVDQLVTAVVLERLSRPDAAELLVRDPGVDLAALHTRRAALDAELEDWRRLAEAGEVTPPSFARAEKGILERLGEVDATIADASRGSALEGIADAADPVAVWAKLDLDRRRAIVDELVTVEILAARKGRRPGWKPGEPYFDPDTVRITPKRG
jgi:DNA invertase Pin-like site-specific DNA recombinase